MVNKCKKVVTVKFSSSVSNEMYGERCGEYACWYILIIVHDWRDQPLSDLLYSPRRETSTWTICNLNMRSTSSTSSLTLWRQSFAILPASRLLAGKSFIVRCHVTSKWPMRFFDVGKKTSYKRMVNKNNNFMTAANLLPRSFFLWSRKSSFLSKKPGYEIGSLWKVELAKDTYYNLPLSGLACCGLRSLMGPRVTRCISSFPILLARLLSGWHPILQRVLPYFWQTMTLQWRYTNV